MNSIVLILSITTLVIVVAYAIWQRYRVAKAKDHHEHSATTADKPHLRKTDGAPGVEPR